MDIAYCTMLIVRSLKNNLNFTDKKTSNDSEMKNSSAIPCDMIETVRRYLFWSGGGPIKLSHVFSSVEPTKIARAVEIVTFMGKTPSDCETE